MTNKIILAVAALAIGVIGYFIGHHTIPVPSFGAIGTNPVENYIPIIKYNEGYYSELGITTTGAVIAGTLQVGTNGSTISELKSTTCNLSITAARLPLATSTQPFQCAVTGVASGDQVYVSLPSDGGSLSGNGGVYVTYAKASTTAGFIEVGLALTPMQVATSSFAGATTSVSVLYIDN